VGQDRKTDRDFALVWAGRAISSAGDWVRHIAIIWLVKELTGSTLAMGTVTLCTLLPYLVFGLFAGAASSPRPSRPWS